VNDPHAAFRRLLALRPIASAVLILAASSSAAAADLLGLYAGGSIGRAQIEATFTVPQLSAEQKFKENHSAYKVTVGLRPISLVGIELAYLDCGHPNGTIAPAGLGNTIDVSMKGAAAFGILYLPVPRIDVYAKAGLARLQSKVNVGAYTQCPDCLTSLPFSVDRTNTGFAAGVGVQLKIAALGARAEYERFSAAGGNQGLASIGVTWDF
jgi:opacity protein-like surface antigen